MIRRIIGQTVLLAVLFAGFFCLSGHAQLNNGTIRGTITDGTGAVLPNANVTLTNLGTQTHFATQSNKTGGYTFTALSPGDYEVDADATGFQGYKGKLTLRVAQEAVIDAKLKPGTVNQSVTVAADVTPLINLADPTLSDVKEATRIETLPLLKSNFLNILAFSPGVVAGGYGGQGSGITRVNGIPGAAVTFMVDGQSANDRYTNDLQSTPQALQTIQEIKVTTSNAPAEYATPGTVDVVTKSGTNQFHGAVHELYQTGSWLARGFNGPPTRPKLNHHEFGGQLGGPVWIPKLYDGHNKTFFYFDVEKQLEKGHATDNRVVPQTNWLTGDFHDYIAGDGSPVTIYDPLSGWYNATTGYVSRTPFAGNIIPAARENAVAKKVFTYIPVPNEPQNNVSAMTGGTENWFDPAAGKIDNIMRYTGKLEQQLGKGLVTARYTHVDEAKLRPDFLGTILDPRGDTMHGHNGGLSYTLPIGANSVNEFRVGVQIYNRTTGPLPFPGLIASLGLPNYPASIAWPGIAWCDAWQCNMASIDRQNPQSYPNQNITAADNFSWTHGRHEVKLGVSVTNSRLITLETGQPGGNYNFDGNFTALQPVGTDLRQTNSKLPNYVTGPTLNTGAGLADLFLGETNLIYINNTPVYHTRQTDYAGYIQDNWKLSHRLTLNLGVRYEYWSSYKDAGGLASALNFNTNTTGTCSIPSARTGIGVVPCVQQGAAGYPSWFAQSQPTVVIPGTQDAFNTAALAGYEAIGLPVQTAAQAGIDQSLWNMPKYNFVPRLGLNYQLDAKTVIRGGYGIYDWTMPLSQYQQNTRHNAPWAYKVRNFTDSITTTKAELAFPFGPTNLFQNQSGHAGVGSTVGPPPYSVNDPLPSGYVDPRQFGSAGTLIDPSKGASSADAFSMATWDPNYKVSMAQEWNVTVERALPGDWALALSYIGNHGSNLVNYDPINAELPRALAPGQAFDASAARTAFPIYGAGGNLGGLDILDFKGYSNHHEGRVELKHTFRGSFIFQTYYSWGKSLTTSESNYSTFGGLEMMPYTVYCALPQSGCTSSDPRSKTKERLAIIYAPDSYLAAKTFGANGNITLPFGKGKRFLGNSNAIVDSIVSGWSASMFFTWHNGLPFAPFYNVAPGISNSSNAYVLAPGATNRGILPRGQRSRQEWFNASVWDPSLGAAYNGQTFMKRTNQLDWDLWNNIPRNYMTGPGFANADGTFYKVTPVTQYAKLILELQVFNVFNHNNVAMPNVGPNQSSITSILGGTTPRLLQIQGKIVF